MEVADRRDVLDRRQRMTMEDRVALLEQSSQRVEAEQLRLKEVIDSRFRALDKGQDLLLAKFELVAANIIDMSSDPTRSAAGRLVIERIENARNELSRDRELNTQRIDALDGEVKGFESRLADLEKFSHQLEGSLWFWKASGPAGLIVAILSLLAAWLRGH